MKLRPNWRLMLDACLGLTEALSGRCTSINQEIREEIVHRFIAQIECRSQEKFPERQSKIVIQAVIQAASLLGPSFPHQVVYFLTKHLRTPERVQLYLNELNGSWQISFCRSCRRYHIFQTSSIIVAIEHIQLTRTARQPVSAGDYAKRPIYVN